MCRVCIAIAAGIVAVGTAFSAGTRAAAQDLKVNFGLVERCLEGKTEETRMQCVGLAADDCQVINDGGGSTVGMGYCLGAERDWWDGRLNSAYRELVAIDTAYDKEFDELNSAVPRKLAVLKAMQRAWITYRDGLCEYEYVQWGGGTGAGPASAACEMVETARQYFILADRLEESRE